MVACGGGRVAALRVKGEMRGFFAALRRTTKKGKGKGKGKGNSNDKVRGFFAALRMTTKKPLRHPFASSGFVFGRR